MNPVILQGRGLSKDFGGFLAVKNVDIAVKRGTIHALIGPNGAGKTTLFNLLTKFIQPTAGSIVYDGRDITGLRPAAVARIGIVRSFQISAVFPQFTVLENVKIALQRKLKGQFRFWRAGSTLDTLDERATEFISAVGLQDSLHHYAADLPYGRRRALEIATTLSLEPNLLLLDEPMAGLGREDVRRVSDLIARVGRQHTILLVEHNLSVVAELSHTITVLARGRVIAEGNYAEVSANADVRSAYLGRKHA